MTVVARRVFGTVKTPAGATLADVEVRLELSAAIADGVSPAFVQVVLTTTTNGSGVFSIASVVPNDNPGIQPTGTTYRLTLKLNGKLIARPRDVVIPYDAGGADLDLFSLTPTAAEPPVFGPYVLESAVGSHNGVASLDAGGQVPSSQLGHAGGATVLTLAYGDADSLHVPVLTSADYDTDVGGTVLGAITVGDDGIPSGVLQWQGTMDLPDGTYVATLNIDGDGVIQRITLMVQTLDEDATYLLAFDDVANPLAIYVGNNEFGEIVQLKPDGTIVTKSLTAESALVAANYTFPSSDGNAGDVITTDGSGQLSFGPPAAAGLESVTGGAGISVNVDDPDNPEIDNTGVIAVEAGAHIDIDDEDPQHPVIGISPDVFLELAGGTMSGDLHMDGHTFDGIQQAGENGEPVEYAQWSNMNESIEEEIAGKASIEDVPAPATATPVADSGDGATGTSTKYAREDHEHPASASSGWTPRDPVQTVLTNPITIPSDGTPTKILSVTIDAPDDQDAVWMVSGQVQLGIASSYIWLQTQGGSESAAHVGSDWTWVDFQASGIVLTPTKVTVSAGDSLVLEIWARDKDNVTDDSANVFAGAAPGATQMNAWNVK